MILCMDYLPSKDVLEWANEVVKSHPNHNVILTTHAFLTAAGERLTKQTGFVKGAASDYPDDGIWTELVEKNNNIQMVLSGHISAKDIVRHKYTRKDGSKVETMLIDPQDMDLELGATGMVAMFYFGEVKDNSVDIQIRYYSTTRQEYYSTAISNCTTNISIVDNVENESIGSISNLELEQSETKGKFTDLTFTYSGDLTKTPQSKFAVQVVDLKDDSKVNAEATFDDGKLKLHMTTSVLPHVMKINTETLMTSYDLKESITIADSVKTIANKNISLDLNKEKSQSNICLSSNYNMEMSDNHCYQLELLADGLENTAIKTTVATKSLKKTKIVGKISKKLKSKR